MLARSRSALVVALAVAALGLAGCSNDDDPSGRTGDAEQVLNEALTAHAAGDLDQAVDLYEQVLVLDPQNRFAYYNLGLIDQTRGHDAAAADEYEQAIAVAPDFAPAMFNLAIIRAEQGAIDEAIALYRDVIAVDETDARAHLNLGFLLIDAGERKEGQRELDRAVELDPSLESRITGGEPVEGESGP
jgi:tetratricopeptide (TPR) repeat protein